MDNGIRGLIINLNKDFKKIEFSDKIVSRSIEELGIGFLFAPLFHPVLKNVGKLRKETAAARGGRLKPVQLSPAGAARARPQLCFLPREERGQGFEPRARTAP